MLRKILATALLCFAGMVSTSYAQVSPVILPNGCGTANFYSGTGYLTTDSTGKLCAAVTASVAVSGFHTESSLTPVTATTGGASSSAFTAGKAILASNTGSTNTAYCAPGNSATTSSTPILPGQTVQIQTTSETAVTCITSASTTTVSMQVGTGLATGWGGSGSGGSGGAVTLASGAVASGAYSAGAYAAGAVVAGAFVDGWDVTQGAKADSACGTATGTCSVVALLKFLNTAVGSAIPAGTNLIGDVNLRQGGTALSATNGIYTNLLQGNAVIASGNPLFAQLTAGSASIGAVGADPSKGGATPASAAISVSTATTTQLVAISGSTKIYVTSYDVISAGTGNITFVYGTGSSCGTGTTSLTGAYPLTAQAGIAKGNGVGAVLIVPAGNALCVTTTAAVQMSGSVSYQQF